jgi:hypothetical protein
VQWVGAEILYKDDTAGIAAVGQEDDATKNCVEFGGFGGAPKRACSTPGPLAKVLSQPAELGLQPAGRDANRERAVVGENESFNCEWQ